MRKKTWVDGEIINSDDLNRIENRVQELHGSYSPYSWETGDIITSERLNNIETAIESEKQWQDGEVINAEKLNAIEDRLETVAPVVYGFSIDADEPDPDLKVTYIEDAVGKSPAYMDFESGQFNYGSWTLDEFFMPRPCMVRSDGTVDYYLDIDDYNKKEDSTASDVDNPDYDGNAMMEWGRDGKKIWYSFTPTNEEQTSVEVRFSNEKVDDSYHDWSFYNKNNEEKDHFYTPIFVGGLVNNKLRSLSGLTPRGEDSTAQQRTYAQANGEGWDIEQYSDYVLVTLLLTLLCKSTDTQSKYGNTASTYSIVSGIMNQNGMFYGENTNTSTTKIKVFGMEYWWGSMWRRLLGYTINARVPTFKLTPGTADGSTASDFNATGASTGYLSVSSQLPSSGYITKMKFESNGIMYPVQAGGSTTTHYCDYVYANSGSSHVALFGCYSGSAAPRQGAWFLRLSYDGSLAYSDYGACLSLKPMN